ncbi:MAG TPA: hypothetical protein DCW68_06625 [Rhodospirillaceae bacterium]|nr:MAG: hypothetical protein A2018_01135 [Alphaproteobacteria bacterium GWF2_58_20]HAU29761.1 hypothetical protein [Rhodospirillaceae bacterium]
MQRFFIIILTICFSISNAQAASVSQATRYRARKQICNLIDDPLCQSWTTPPLPSGTNPTVISFFPATGAGETWPDTDLWITFDQPITKGSGEITIYRYSDDSSLWSVDVSEDGVLVSGNSVRIDLDIVLESNTTYYITYPEGAFANTSGLTSEAMTGKDTWHFTTKTYGRVVDWEIFAKDDTTYGIEITAYSTSTAYNTLSTLYEFDPINEEFVPLQFFQTYGPRDVDVFEYNSQTYVLITNMCKNNCASSTDFTTTFVQLYRFNPATRNLDLVQNIGSHGACDTGTFIHGGTIYAMVANTYYYTNMGQCLHQFNPGSGAWGQFATGSCITGIFGESGYDWKFFQSGTNTYGIRGRISSRSSLLYRFNSATRTMAQIQDLGMANTSDWEILVDSGNIYALSINVGSSSQIYKFNPVTERFLNLQTMGDSGGNDWELFLVDGEIYAIAALGIGPHPIYRFNRATETFVSYKTINDTSLITWKVFHENGKTYLISGGYTGSKIYRFDLL